MRRIKVILRMPSAQVVTMLNDRVPKNRRRSDPDADRNRSKKLVDYFTELIKPQALDLRSPTTSTESTVERPET